MPADIPPSEALYPWNRPRRSVPAPVRVALLGATGSIGRQTVDLALRHPARLHIVVVAINSCVSGLAELLAELAALPERDPPWVAVFDPAAREEAAGLPVCRDRLLAAGQAGLEEAASWPAADCVVNGLVGAAGLAPTLAAARAGKRVALANKESLVVGGELVAATVCKGGAELLPVDSEHSAIAQCLTGRRREELEKIILTASGGPFRGYSRQQMAAVTPAEALDHPTWRMGPKISVDSATLMNKGLEVIEAYHLFGLPYTDIDVVVHPGSVIHSFVVLRDGAIMAQLGTPDMRVPLLYAISGENHWPLATERLDLLEVSPLRFEEPDLELFPCLRLARQAGRDGGRAPIVLNAANEVAVDSFLAEKLRFVDIPAVIEESLANLAGGRVADLAEALAVDREARKVAAAFIHQP